MSWQVFTHGNKIITGVELYCTHRQHYRVTEISENRQNQTLLC